MSRPGVTYTEIAEAAAHLVGQGKNPTIEQIRLLVGSGSSTTIANHLKQWKERQQGTSLLAAKENIPGELVEIVKGLWERVIGLSQEKMAVVETEFTKTVDELQEELLKYKTNNQRWQKMYDQWGKEKEELAREKLEDKEVINSLQKDNAALITKFDSQQQQMVEKQQRIDELNRLHKLAQENLEHYRESSRVQRLVDQDKYAQQLQEVRISLKNTEQQLHNSHEDKQKLQQQLNNALHANANMTDKFNKLEEEFSESKRNTLHWQKQSEMVQNKFNDTHEKLSHCENKIMILTEQLSAAKIEAKEAKDQNKLLAHDKWEIAQEKARLEGRVRQMEKITS